MQTTSVLIVSSEFPPQPGGIGDHAYNLALQLTAHGYLVRVIADGRSDDGEEERVFDGSLPFEVHRVRVRSPRLLMYLERLRILFGLIQTTNQVIATGKFSLWSSAICSWLYKRNYLAVVHGTEVNFKSYAAQTAVNNSLKRFDTIIAVSNYTKSLIAHLNLDVVVIPNGFNPNKWKGCLEDFIELKGHPKLTTVGNVTTRKGQWQVISHLPELLKAYPDLHYHCVGLKTEVADCIALATQLGVQDHVTFHGRMDDDRLKSILLQTDIFVMLSGETATGDVEGFGIAILEANALGVPAIGSINCGIEDAISMGTSGVLVDPKDSHAFLYAIQTILNQKTSFQEGAINWAETHQWSDVIQQYLKLL